MFRTALTSIALAAALSSGAVAAVAPQAPAALSPLEVAKIQARIKAIDRIVLGQNKPTSSRMRVKSNMVGSTQFWARQGMRESGVLPANPVAYSPASRIYLTADGQTNGPAVEALQWAQMQDARKPVARNERQVYIVQLLLERRELTQRLAK